MAKTRKNMELARVQPSELAAPEPVNTPRRVRRHVAAKAVMRGMVEGKSVEDSAKTAGVSKSSVYRWLKANPKFMAELHACHEEIEQACRNRMVETLYDAADSVEAAIREGDAKLGYQLLKDMGAIQPRTPFERLTEADDVRREQELEAKRQRVGRDCEHVKLATDRVVADFQYEHWTDGKKMEEVETEGSD